ncbi:hypothetical protein HDU93_000787, partial [Gonapodya sp. JEL0774]
LTNRNGLVRLNSPLNIYSTVAASTITLACLLLGENVPFVVSIAPSLSVDSLKTAIKEELTPKLSDIAANNLELWKVDVPYAARASITEDTLKEEDVMGPLDETSEYFQVPLPKSAFTSLSLSVDRKV